jgi:hypothetical protein
MRRLFKHGRIQPASALQAEGRFTGHCFEKHEIPSLVRGEDNGKSQKGFQVGDLVSFR